MYDIVVWIAFAICLFAVKRRKFQEYANKERYKCDVLPCGRLAFLMVQFLRPHCEQVCPQFFIGRMC